MLRTAPVPHAGRCRRAPSEAASPLGEGGRSAPGETDRTASLPPATQAQWRSAVSREGGGTLWDKTGQTPATGGHPPTSTSSYHTLPPTQWDSIKRINLQIKLAPPEKWCGGGRSQPTPTTLIGVPHPFICQTLVEGRGDQPRLGKAGSPTQVEGMQGGDPPIRKG